MALMFNRTIAALLLNLGGTVLSPIPCFGQSPTPPPAPPAVGNPFQDAGAPDAKSPKASASDQPSTTLDAPGDTGVWERYVRGFRREHNFALASGVSSGTWRIKHFASLNNELVNSAGAWLRFQYSYHLQIFHGFGYLLGSSAGYYYESVNDREVFKPVPAWQFPGLTVGLVFNATPTLRISSAFDAYLERHNNIQDRGPAGQGDRVSVTIQAYDAGLFLDIFYQLEWALRLEGHRRMLVYKRPLIPPSGCDDCAVDASFTKDDQWLGIGICYHLL